MAQVTAIKNHDFDELEFAINNELAELRTMGATLIDIKFSTTPTKDENNVPWTEFSALVIYQTKEET
jgi:hypothetical protein